MSEKIAYRFACQNYTEARSLDCSSQGILGDVEARSQVDSRMLLRLQADLLSTS